MRRRLPPPNGRVRIAPSLLAADFGHLLDAIRMMERAGADWISVDVMDGHFVPNLSFGPEHVRALRRRTGMLLDAHLMVEDIGRYAPVFAEAGADIVIGHVEANARPRRWMKELRSKGVAVGLAVKPKTPASALEPYLKDLDLALVMTVEPGFGGQAFRRDMLPKIRALRQKIDRLGRRTWLMVDGGINPETVALAAEAGADAFVAGTSVLRAPDPKKAFRSIRAIAQEIYDRRTR